MCGGCVGMCGCEYMYLRVAEAVVLDPGVAAVVDIAGA